MASATEQYALLALYQAARREAGQPVDYFAVTRDAGYPAEESERVLGVLASQRLVQLADLGNLVALTEEGARIAGELEMDLPDESGVRAGLGARRSSSGSGSRE